MVTITSTASRPEWQRAMVKATEQDRAGVRARLITGRSYEVTSAHTNTFYTVEVINPTTLRALCSCPHGLHADEPHCWHICLCLCAAVERVSRKRPAPKARPSAEAIRWMFGDGPEPVATSAELDARVRRLYPNAA